MLLSFTANNYIHISANILLLVKYAVTCFTKKLIKKRRSFNACNEILTKLP